MAFDRISPFGDERADLRTGILASLTANIHRKKGAAAFTPADFMPFLERAKKDHASGLSSRLRAAFASFKGKGR